MRIAPVQGGNAGAAARPERPHERDRVPPRDQGHVGAALLEGRTDPATGQTSFGIGVGTIVLAINVVLLGGYALGCHTLRHVIGGKCDELKSDTRAQAYRCVSCLNERHMLWAWCSLFSVAFADIYVRLCAMGVWTDWRLV